MWSEKKLRLEIGKEREERKKREKMRHRNGGGRLDLVSNAIEGPACYAAQVPRADVLLHS